jgi:hypothetical protein
MSDIFRFRDAAREVVAQARKGLRYDARSGRFLDERGDPAGNGSTVLAMAVRESPAEVARQIFEASVLERRAAQALLERRLVDRSSVDHLSRCGDAGSRNALRSAKHLQPALDALVAISVAVDRA